jgi:hypothetical protein
VYIAAFGCLQLPAFVYHAGARSLSNANQRSVRLTAVVSKEIEQLVVTTGKWRNGRAIVHQVEVPLCTFDSSFVRAKGQGVHVPDGMVVGEVKLGAKIVTVPPVIATAAVACIHSTCCSSQIGSMESCLVSLGTPTTDRCGRQIGGNKLDRHMSTAQDHNGFV